ncbi:MAG: hypothetical protein JO165_04435, partial [Candidatus Eremiobacteraeota bacterium]|nr:hypothetical protein [Candidatus Eremiobacteraeota bacterium]
GEAAIARGKDVEAFISETLNAALGRGAPAVHCPSQMDLTGKNRGVCYARVPHTTLRVRFGVWIDEALGIRERPIDVVIDRKRVQNTAQEDLNRRLVDNGDAPDAVVVCDKGLLVVVWPSTFDCKARVGGKPYKLVVTVQDFRGTVNWRGVPL